ncbi:MAG: DinB family protein [Gemmatimonadaceae bacterium]
MSTTTTQKVAASPATDATMLTRIATEGYGDGAWHGNDLKAALAEVTPELAFWRPGPGRHNIAEIGLHHAYTARSVRARLAGSKGIVEPFVLAGEDWFELDDDHALSWPTIRDTVASQQERLVEAIGALQSVRLSDQVKPFDLILGITCHAIYHAGQIQLIKVLRKG